LEEPKGVLVPQVTEGSAADEAGLQHNDIILEFDGKSIESAAQLRNLVAKHKPGTRVKIVVLRDGERKTLAATLEERPPMEELAGEKEPSRDEDTTQTLGLAVQDLTPDLAQRFGYEGQTGVIVTRVLPGSEAAEKGLRPGYLIKEIDRQRVKSARRFKQLASKALAENGQILLLVHNGQASQYVVLELPED
jgi:serine protease Do